MALATAVIGCDDGATGNAVASCPSDGLDACIGSVVTDFDQRLTRHLAIER